MVRLSLDLDLSYFCLVLSVLVIGFELVDKSLYVLFLEGSLLGSGVGMLWVLRGMLPGGLLTSIDNEIEHSRIAKLALNDEGIAPSQYRLITNPITDVMSKLADRAYDLVILRHDPEDLTYTVEDAHRILRSGGVLVIDSFFGGGKVPDPTQRDAKSIALRETGKMIKASSELWVSSLINVGDGLLLATKL